MGRRRQCRCDACPAGNHSRGPERRGKSTAAGFLIPPSLPFLNADDIARDLDPVDPAAAAVSAGRKMRTELDWLTSVRADFAFETTLSGRTYAPRLRRWRDPGYEVFLLFLWLPDPDVALHRIGTRVARGGHDIPADTVRRCHSSGVRNFFHLHRPLASTWRVYDATDAIPRIVADGAGASAHHVYAPSTWQAIREQGRAS